VEEAIRQGFAAYGFSSHAPVPFETLWSMKKANLDRYYQEIKALKQQYQVNIQIYCGLEVDFIPGVVGPQSTFIKDDRLDYTIGSVHFVDAFPDGRHWEIDGTNVVFAQGLTQIFQGNIQAAVSRYFELTRQMVIQECPDVIGHLDKIKMQNKVTGLFSEEATWYQDEIKKTLQVIKESPALVEVNTRGLYKNKASAVYPGPWVLAQMHRLNIPVTISSDAHHPSEVSGYFTAVAQLLLDIGYREIHVLYNGTWEKVAFNSEGILL
jgi:histidinol-phosphatase (PHP family)